MLLELARDELMLQTSHQRMDLNLRIGTLCTLDPLVPLPEPPRGVGGGGGGGGGVREACFFSVL